jgi:hypothetical protein
MNGESIRIWKKSIVANLKIKYQHSRGRNEENRRNLVRLDCNHADTRTGNSEIRAGLPADGNYLIRNSCLFLLRKNTHKYFIECISLT